MGHFSTERINPVHAYALSDLMEAMITEPKKPTMLELIQRNASGEAYSSASLPTTVGPE